MSCAGKLSALAFTDVVGEGDEPSEEGEVCEDFESVDGFMRHASKQHQGRTILVLHW